MTKPPSEKPEPAPGAQLTRFLLQSHINSLTLQAMNAMASFIAISLIWGLTWIAIKAGVNETPPLFYAATRFIAAGMILACLFRRRIDWRLPDRQWLKLSVIAVFFITLCYGPIFWGVRHVSSGLSGVINLGLIPVGLLVIGVVFGEETLSWRKAASIILGLTGLLLLFAPDLDDGSSIHAQGAIAIIAGTFSYCLGSVLSKRWLKNLPTETISAAVTFIGGVGLLVLSLLSEPLDGNMIRAMLHPRPLAGWAFLVIGGSVIAFTLYLQLLAIWGPLRAGLYAFISPIVAVIAGYLVFDERLTALQMLASAILLGAAAITLWKSEDPL